MTRNRAAACGFLAGLSILAFEARAQECTIENRDVSDALKRMPDVLAVQTSNRRDPDSEEPVLREVVDFADGTTLVLEQQNCLMHNLRVTLLSPGQTPDEAGLRRLGAALAVPPVWARYFARYDPVAIATALGQAPEFSSLQPSGGQFSTPLGDRLTAQDESSEAILSFMSTDAYAAQYRSMLSLYIGVGGQ